ncbi:unnamed protein product [Dimorphilus gyrociliatus]|uniref:Uncharacterized protein n=1 Tax=Dimorphilus gyrociliatus TaxID=2664684 RepID=A0A7I8W8U0_9ANNE|nr:unnamed protein product [Dimorphilus gyrociliatus]
MFGVIVPGKMVQTELVQISENQIVCNIPDHENVHHIVVFLTGQTPIPDNYGAAIYLSWPGSGSEQSWTLLGHVTNEKPSAMFKISGVKPKESGNGMNSVAMSSTCAQLGIAIESAAEIYNQTPASNTVPSNLANFQEFSFKMCENLFNYISSFSIKREQIHFAASETFVPMSALQGWYKNFLRKIDNDPNFWKS